jgi:hypothetical protein
MRESSVAILIADTGIGFFQKSNVSEHDSEQVIEVVRDAGRKLTNRFQSLHLAQRRLNLLLFLDLSDKLPVGRGQFCRAFLNPRFQSFVQTAHACLRLPRVCFAFMQRFETGARLVLLFARRQPAMTYKVVGWWSPKHHTPSAPACLAVAMDFAQTAAALGQ